MQCHSRQQVADIASNCDLDQPKTFSKCLVWNQHSDPMKAKSHL
jgi:hypothetical protein